MNCVSLIELNTSLVVETVQIVAGGQSSAPSLPDGTCDALVNTASEFSDQSGEEDLIVKNWNYVIADNAFLSIVER